MNQIHLLLKTLGKNPDLISPYGNTVIVKLLEAQTESAGGILLPEQVRNNNRQIVGRVISVGEGQRSIITSEFIKGHSEPGDLVIMLEHGIREIIIGGETFHAVFEGDIIGKIDESRLNELMEKSAADLVDSVQDPEDGTETYESGKISQTEGGIFVVSGTE